MKDVPDVFLLDNTASHLPPYRPLSPVTRTSQRQAVKVFRKISEKMVDTYRSVWYSIFCACPDPSGR